MISLREAQLMVKRFHAKHGFSHGLLNEDMVGQVDYLTAGLVRSHLIGEELSEMAIAWAANDIVSVADALADLLYVVLGTAVTLGIELEPLFAEVHRSNMTKSVKRGRAEHPAKDSDYSPPDIKGALKAQGL